MKIYADASREPIAIIGMSCRLPGANDPDSLWTMVIDQGEGVAEYPGGRTPELDAFYRRVGMPDGPASSRGGFLPDIDKFDAAFFGISPREAEWLDPQQRLLLETGWETLEDAGIPLEALAKEKTGVFVGVWNNDYERHTTANSPVAEFFLVTGGPLYCASSRVAYQFDLSGPDVSVNAACGSSLVAVHLATRSLRSGECSLAFAGGVNVVVRHEFTQAYSRAKMLSPGGRCKFGSAAADGFVRSDGVGMLLLKRLADARRDGDRVLAVIRGTGMANDGRGIGSLATPSAAGQRRAMLEALADAGVGARTVDYVEAHGTGTRAGDPIEISAIASVFGRLGEPAQACRIGSVKSNIGHTESAAGVASIIRVVQALHHRRYPATLHVSEPTAEIDWETAGLMLERAGAEWTSPKDGPRRAAVNGLGLTGTNAHVILEESQQAERAITEPRAAYVFPLSAAAGAALKDRAKDLALALHTLQEGGDAPESLSDFCYTASVRRSHLAHRLAVTGANAAELLEGLEAFAKGQESPFVSAGAVEDGRKPKIAFVFPGQGSQWLGMGRELLRTSPVFRRSMEEIDEAIKRETGWSALEQLEDPSLEERLARIDVVQPSLFAMEVALAELWKSWGVIPEAVVGHSMGEVAAACFAGILSRQDAVRIICRRSALLMRVAGAGAMVVVDLPRADAERLITSELAEKISVAVSNSPRSTVLAGDPAALDGIVERLEKEDVFCRWVRVDVASHSPQMDPLTIDLSAALAEVKPSAGTIPMYSTVSVGRIDGIQMGATYWVRNLRKPVLFANAIEEMLSQGFDTFVEVGPHPILVPFVEQTSEYSGRAALAVGSLRRDAPETAAILAALGRLYTAGADVAWKAVYPAGNLVKLPAYPWQRERFWMQSSAAKTGFRSVSGHPLAGEPLKTATGAWVWTTKLSAEAHPWLKDHAVGGTALLPASAYIELAGAAANSVFAGAAAAVTKLQLSEAAPLSAEGDLELQIVATEESHDVCGLKFFVREDEASEWGPTADCLLRRVAADESKLAELKAWEDAEFSSGTTIGAQHAERMAELGYSFGPSFCRIEWLAFEGASGLARIRLPEELRRESYLLHPAALDAAMQVLGRLLIETSGNAETLLPVSLEHAEWKSIPIAGDALYARATANSDATAGDVELFDDAGRLIVTIRALAFRPLQRSQRQKGESLYEIRWEQLTAQAGEGRGRSAGKWLLIADRSGAAEVLSEVLEFRGASPIVVEPSTLLGGAGLDAIFELDAISGVVWLTPLDLSRSSTLAEAQRVLAEGAGIVSRLADIDDGSDRARIWVITRGTQSVNGEAVNNVLGAGAWGFFASVSNEHPLLQASCLDLPEDRLEREFDLLADALLANGNESRIALRESSRFAARLSRFEPGANLAQRIPISELRSTQHESESFELVQNVPGSLDGFELVSAWTEAPSDSEVEIAVEAAGLNFRDVLSAMGVDESIAGSRFGGECAGTVVRVGSGVKGLRPGDEVLAISGCFQTGTFASRVKVPEALVVKKPEKMSFAQAAGIPCVFLTAWYGLVKLARLQKGERVLIHAAAGGVGLAAIQIAKWVGAEIYATVGSDEKREYLQSLGVKHIMHSRNLDFAREILETTGAQGVDVVLNSLAGPAITAGLEALAPYGRFVEIGKRDIWENSRIGMRPFLKNLSLFAVDLSQAVEDRRTMVASMLTEIMEMFDQGIFEPLPSSLFPVSEAGNAFQLMARGGHIGKIILNLRDEAAMVRRNHGRLTADATYLITGGLGGLGLVTAKAFVERGARNLVLTSRRSPSEEVLRAVHELEELGARVTIRLADVSVEAEVGALLDEIGETMPPLRGIVHAAGILDDAVVMHLSAARFESVMAAKVGGALAMDAKVQSGDLDFLIYYSSVAGVLGNPGQANYAAANATLDSLAHSQRARGIPAISIDWGTWGETGLAAASENRGARMAVQGLNPLTSKEGAALVIEILEEAPVQIAAMNLDADRWCCSHPAAAGSGLFTNLMRQSANPARDGGDFVASLRLLAGEQLHSTLIAWLRQQVAAVLRLDFERVPQDKPLRSLGLDSLMTLELRNRLERNLRLKLSATLVWNYPTITAMAAHLEGRLAARLPGETEAPSSAITGNGTTKTQPSIPQSEPDNKSIAEMLEAELRGAESLLKG
jgi:acyl transferase domain-containing protein/NADPH:quinone reductase-like Zn-dependent oxidoreductase/NAD(P)-dependent dehydrogenase (short-subunit alcohol dehydrogenase family)/acyl carrier protein